MAAMGSDRNGVDDVVAQDLEERMGYSDEADADYSNDQLSDGEESQSLPKTVQANSQKRRSEGGSSGEARRHARLHPSPSNMELVLTKLRQHPAVAARGPDFIFDVMEYVKREDFDYFALFNEDDITRYLQRRGPWNI